jgi:hypothetical protein
MNKPFAQASDNRFARFQSFEKILRALKLIGIRKVGLPIDKSHANGKQSAQGSRQEKPTARTAKQESK